MKILIYGAGAIGSIFAGKLSNAGYDVTVLARNQRYNEISTNGIILKNAYSNHQEISKVKVINFLESDDSYDYILVVMQKIQVNAVLPFLSQNCSKNVVFVVNNALGYDKWVESVGRERLMIGFPSAGGERKNGVVNYFIGGGIVRTFQTTTFGEADGSITPRLTKIVEAFKRAHIPSVTTKNIAAWQKTHVAMVTSIGNALYMHKSNNYELSKSREDICLMIHGIKEGFKVIEAIGFRVTPRKLWYFKLPTRLLAVVFKIIMNTKIAEVAMAKHTIVAKNEMRELQKEFDTLIAESRIPTPAIDTLKKSVLIQS